MALLLFILLAPSSLVEYQHQGRPHLSPAWAVVSSGNETVLIDGTVYVRHQ